MKSIFSDANTSKLLTESFNSEPFEWTKSIVSGEVVYDFDVDLGNEEVFEYRVKFMKVSKTTIKMPVDKATSKQTTMIGFGQRMPGAGKFKQLKKIIEPFRTIGTMSAIMNDFLVSAKTKPINGFIFAFQPKIYKKVKRVLPMIFKKTTKKIKHVDVNVSLLPGKQFMYFCRKNVDPASVFVFPEYEGEFSPEAIQSNKDNNPGIPSSSISTDEVTIPAIQPITVDDKLNVIFSIFDEEYFVQGSDSAWDRWSGAHYFGYRKIINGKLIRVRVEIENIYNAIKNGESYVPGEVIYSSVPDISEIDFPVNPTSLMSFLSGLEGIYGNSTDTGSEKTAIFSTYTMAQNVVKLMNKYNSNINVSSYEDKVTITNYDESSSITEEADDVLDAMRRLDDYSWYPDEFQYDFDAELFLPIDENEDWYGVPIPINSDWKVISNPSQYIIHYQDDETGGIVEFNNGIYVYTLDGVNEVGTGGYKHLGGIVTVLKEARDYFKNPNITSSMKMNFVAMEFEDTYHLSDGVQWEKITDEDHFIYKGTIDGEDAKLTVDMDKIYQQSYDMSYEKVLGNLDYGDNSMEVEVETDPINFLNFLETLKAQAIGSFIDSPDTDEDEVYLTEISYPFNGFDVIQSSGKQARGYFLTQVKTYIDNSANETSQIDININPKAVVISNITSEEVNLFNLWYDDVMELMNPGHSDSVPVVWLEFEDWDLNEISNEKVEYTNHYGKFTSVISIDGDTFSLKINGQQSSLFDNNPFKDLKKDVIEVVVSYLNGVQSPIVSWPDVISWDQMSSANEFQMQYIRGDITVLIDRINREYTIGNNTEPVKFNLEIKSLLAQIWEISKYTPGTYVKVDPTSELWLTSEFQTELKAHNWIGRVSGISGLSYIKIGIPYMPEIENETISVSNIQEIIFKPSKSSFETSYNWPVISGWSKDIKEKVAFYSLDDIELKFDSISSNYTLKVDGLPISTGVFEQGDIVDIINKAQKDHGKLTHEPGTPLKFHTESDHYPTPKGLKIITDANFEAEFVMELDDGTVIAKTSSGKQFTTKKEGISGVVGETGIPGDCTVEENDVGEVIFTQDETVIKFTKEESIELKTWLRQQ